MVTLAQEKERRELEARECFDRTVQKRTGRRKKKCKSRLAQSNASRQGQETGTVEDSPFCQFLLVVNVRMLRQLPRVMSGNEVALQSFGYTWEEFTALPSRKSCEEDGRGERQELLDDVKQSDKGAAPGELPGVSYPDFDVVAPNRTASVASRGKLSGRVQQFGACIPQNTRKHDVPDVLNDRRSLHRLPPRGGGHSANLARALGAGATNNLADDEKWTTNQDHCSSVEREGRSRTHGRASRAVCD